MSLIDRKFLVDFAKPAGFVVNLLPKPTRDFLLVDLFQIAGAPPVVPFKFNPVSPTATGQLIPSAKFSFILFT